MGCVSGCGFEMQVCAASRGRRIDRGELEPAVQSSVMAFNLCLSAAVRVDWSGALNGYDVFCRRSLFPCIGRSATKLTKPLIKARSS